MHISSEWVTCSGTYDLKRKQLYCMNSNGDNIPYESCSVSVWLMVLLQSASVDLCRRLRIIRFFLDGRLCCVLFPAVFLKLESVFDCDVRPPHHISL